MRNQFQIETSTKLEHGATVESIRLVLHPLLHPLTIEGSVHHAHRGDCGNEF